MLNLPFMMLADLLYMLPGILGYQQPVLGSDVLPGIEPQLWSSSYRPPGTILLLRRNAL
jgi:hypothetical protein